MYYNISMQNPIEATSQKSAWEFEIATGKGIMTSYVTNPSGEIEDLLDFALARNLGTGNRAIDLGCGEGRNAIWLAKNGFDVTAVDFAQPALNELKKSIIGTQLEPHITIQNVDLTEKLPFADNSFDLILDVTADTSLNRSQLELFAAETSRIAKPNALLICCAIAPDDGVLAALNPTGGSVTTAGLTDYFWSESQLKEAYSNWKILSTQHSRGSGMYFGKKYNRHYIWFLAQNKK